MDLSRLSTATKVITGAAIVLFIVSFLSWATVSGGGFSVSQNGWHGFIGILFGLSVVLLIAWQAVKVFGVKLPELPAGDRQIELGVIGAVVVLTVLKVLTTSDVSVNGASAGDRVWWVQILALLAAAAIGWGGWQIYSGAAEDAPAAASSGDSPVASSPPAPAAPAAPAPPAAPAAPAPPAAPAEPAAPAPSFGAPVAAEREAPAADESDETPSGGGSSY